MPTVQTDVAGPAPGPARRLARKVDDRRGSILKALTSGEEISLKELIARTSASPATFRRDLRTLEQQGLVRRVRRGVSLSNSRAFEQFYYDPGFREQVHHLSAEKRRIATAAAALVSDAETIGLAAGTTVGTMSRLLKSRRQLTVVTNALNVAMDLSRQKTFTVHLCGGYLSGDWFALVGPKTLEFISTVFPDRFFLGANGIDPVRGVTDRHTEEAAVNRALAQQSRKRILLVDHTKFGHTASHLVCATRELDTIVTDAGATDETIAPFLEQGIEVIRV